jgi:undecaprenyl-diphosphatase
VTIWQALVLGLIQGVTEFLPISSSGHLVLFQQVFGLTEDILFFDIVLHIATLIAIVVFFGKSLLQVTKREWTLVAVGTVPLALVGVFFQDTIEAMFVANMWVGLELIVTGIINLYTHHRLANVIQDPAPLGEQLSSKNSLLIGIAQAISIIPGISRSSATVAASIKSGLDREAAFRFSFLLAIPALLGAGLVQTKDILLTGMPEIQTGQFVVGFIASLVAGFVSLSVFKYVIMKAQMKWFGWYAILLGVFVLFLFQA